MRYIWHSCMKARVFNKLNKFFNLPRAFQGITLDFEKDLKTLMELQFVHNFSTYNNKLKKFYSVRDIKFMN